MTQTWFITGSSRGFGRALVQTALDAGDQVVATARRPEQLAEFTEKYGDRVLAVALDVTDPAAVDAAVSAGASYADARGVFRRSQSVATKNGNVEAVSDVETEGIGVRVLVDGSWGFAGAGAFRGARAFASSFGFRAFCLGLICIPGRCGAIQANFFVFNQT